MNSRVSELFHALADLPPEARARYFAEHQVEDDIRREVEELLAFDSGASALLERDIGIAASQALPLADACGWRCGSYRLLHVIGRGGMGAVYLAQRADGEVTQQVAVKILPPGAADLQRERFLQERQILASLTHPNIARMLDAGHLDNGQPFLAMEYVEGKPIDTFSAGLTVRQKIALFLEVCAAVGYLHRNLVVHRDLKPSNILVTADGEVKLLDFGIAKMLDLAMDVTLSNMRMLTPDYASPEQVTGGRVTTATDIYSLGALLYYLLTGKPVHVIEERSPEAIAQIVAGREAPRPSKWAPALKGDLDFILLKSLRKDPQERYATVEQFTEDLQAFLDSRPVRARSGNRWYRMRKFVQRYRLPVSAAAAVIASLATSLYIANRERVVAERRFQGVRQLANKLFDIDVQVRDLPGSTHARQLIVNTSLEYLRRLTADAGGDPELELEVGNAYMQVARAQGVPISPNLGHMDEAEKTLQIADDVIHSVLAAEPANRNALLRSGQIAHDRMILARLSGRHEETLPLARKSAEALEKFHAGPSDKPQSSAILNTYENVADQLRMEQQLDDALWLCRRGSELARGYGSRRYLADFLRVTATVLRERGDLDEALETVRESVKLIQASNREDPIERVTNNLDLTLVYEGRILGEDGALSLGRSAEAVAAFERAFRMADDWVHQDSKDQLPRGILAMAGIGLADIVRHSDARQALEIYDHTLRQLAEIQNNRSFQRYEVNVLAGSSYALRSLGRTAEARERLDRAFARLSQLKMYPAQAVEPGSQADKALGALADYEAGIGNPGRAVEIYQELLRKLEAGSAKPETILSDAADVSQIYRSLAVLYRRAGRADLASAMESRWTGLWQRWDRKLPNNAFVLRQIRAAAHAGVEK